METLGSWVSRIPIQLEPFFRSQFCFIVKNEFSLFAATVQPEQDGKEADHLPFPAIDIPFWNLKRNKRRSIDSVVSDDVSYVDAAQAFNVSF